MADAVSRFAQRAAALGVDPAVRRFPAGTRTAEDAAAAIGCDVAAIVKSLVFVAVDGDAERPVLVLTSGANRVDTALAARALEVPALRKADAAEVRAATGYAIGGTPPFGHDQPLEVLVDEDLLELEEVWAAAGTPDAVFPLTPVSLLAATGATTARVAAG